MVSSRKCANFALAKQKWDANIRGALVQLVRISACHAGGHEFESRTHRNKKRRKAISSFVVFYGLTGLKLDELSGFVPNGLAGLAPAMNQSISCPLFRIAPLLAALFHAVLFHTAYDFGKICATMFVEPCADAVCHFHADGWVDEIAGTNFYG